MGITVGHDASARTVGNAAYGATLEKTRNQLQRQRIAQLGQNLGRIGGNIRARQARSEDLSLRREGMEAQQRRFETELDFRRESRDLARRDAGKGLGPSLEDVQLYSDNAQNMREAGYTDEEIAQSLRGTPGAGPNITRDLYDSLSPIQRGEWDQYEQALSSIAQSDMRPEQKQYATEQVHKKMQQVLQSPGAMRSKYPPGREPGKPWKGPGGGWFQTDPETGKMEVVLKPADMVTPKEKAQIEYEKKQRETYYERFTGAWEFLNSQRGDNDPAVTEQDVFNFLKDMESYSRGRIPDDKLDPNSDNKEVVTKRAAEEARKRVLDMRKDALMKGERSPQAGAPAPQGGPGPEDQFWRKKAGHPSAQEPRMNPRMDAAMRNMGVSGHQVPAEPGEMSRLAQEVERIPGLKTIRDQLSGRKKGKPAITVGTAKGKREVRQALDSAIKQIMEDGLARETFARVTSGMSPEEKKKALWRILTTGR